MAKFCGVSSRAVVEVGCAVRKQKFLNTSLDNGYCPNNILVILLFAKYSLSAYGKSEVKNNYDVKSFLELFI
jgi:hypothetical protein